MKQDLFKKATTATVFTVIFSVVTALILPVGYYLITSVHLRGTLETEAEINAKLLSRVIITNPELWQYETIRIEELLTRRPRSGAAETRRIFDKKHNLVAESVNLLHAPLITASHNVTDGGEVVARIEISRSSRPIIVNSAILAIFGLFIGLLLYRMLPFQALIKAGKELQDANDFLLKVMEGSSNSLVAVDPAGNIRMFNQRFELLTGQTRKELLGQPFCHLFSGSTQAHVEAELRKVTMGDVEQTKFEVVLLRRDHMMRNLSCGILPLLSDEKVNGAVISLDDITERINAEEERLELERYVHQTHKMESLGVLAGGIAHDFNNILAIIMGYCEAINDHVDPLSPHADYVNKIKGAAIRAGDICHQMLSYAGKNEPEHSLINLNSLLDEMVKMLHSGINKNVTIDLYLSDTPVIADSSQIQQIVMNLIINAAEAIGDNDGTIRISLNRVEIVAGQSDKDFNGRPILAGRYVCLEVADNGCGMDEETQHRIFEPFFTTKFTGRGLGMSSTLGIIKSHGGALQLSSTPDAGTTFKVYLPLSDISITADDKPTSGQIPDIKASGTILLVDDEEELRALGTIRLNKIGFSVKTSASGLDAVETFREHGDKIDLILLDLLMPEISGIKTYHRLREISKNMPIVFCSGCSIEELPADILIDNKTGFLKKPYKPDQLRDILAKMLG